MTAKAKQLAVVPQLRLIPGGVQKRSAETMPRPKPKVEPLEAPPMKAKDRGDRGTAIQGRLESEEMKNEIRAACVMHGISFEKWIGWVVLKAYKAKEFPPKEE
jgi:hypothetical protein